MYDEVDDLQPDDSEVKELARLTEELTRRLESGEPLNAAECMAAAPATAGSIRQILPTLKAMVSLGDQVAREMGSREQRKRKSS